MFQYEDDANRVMSVLGKRMAKFKLELAFEKTRILPFGRWKGTKEKFDFLGFTFLNAKTRAGFYKVAVITSAKKLKAKREAVKSWLKTRLNKDIVETLKTLNRKLKGHYNYYAVSGNMVKVTQFYRYVTISTFKMLNRRSQKKSFTWEKFNRIWDVYISKPKIMYDLRNFFNYLYEKNIALFSGDALFPVIVTNKNERVLSFYSNEEVRKIISCVDNSDRKGKRDLTIVLLAAELGIRSGDICRLKLENIHWERNTIEFIQFKTKVLNILPLLDNIKYALIDYLKNSRPVCNSELLFVGIKNNYQILSNTQIHGIVSKYFTKSGLDTSKRKHGPHALRHSLASNMLNNNTPMHVIEGVLGHTNLNTTKMYLNIDFKTLKKFALEVPYETN